MFEVTDRDRDILRQLASEKAAIAGNPENTERKRLWTMLNDRKAVRPLVHIMQVPWHEMNVQDELTCICESPFAKAQEGSLRREIYQWHHFPGDMIVEPYMESPLEIKSSGYGLTVDEVTHKLDDKNYISSHEYHSQIKDEGDIDKIQYATVTHDKDVSDTRLEVMKTLYGDVIDVIQMGQGPIWFTPWDYLVRFTGVTEILLDMAMRPDYVRALVDRVVQVKLDELDQYAALNVLCLNSMHSTVGSGGYAYSRDLPASGFDPQNVRTIDQWGSDAPQIFSEVSVDMHWQFALEPALPWLERFGLVYYGCCEPLHNKMAMLKQHLPRLRKVSASPWADDVKMARECGRDIVVSMKPNPALLAEDRWRPDAVREDIKKRLGDLNGCNVEIILKDISTVRYEPKRLWEWAAIVRELVEE